MPLRQMPLRQTPLRNHQITLGIAMATLMKTYGGLRQGRSQVFVSGGAKPKCEGAILTTFKI